MVITPIRRKGLTLKQHFFPFLSIIFAFHRHRECWVTLNFFEKLRNRRWIQYETIGFEYSLCFNRTSIRMGTYMEREKWHSPTIKPCTQTLLTPPLVPLATQHQCLTVYNIQACTCSGSSRCMLKCGCHKAKRPCQESCSCLERKCTNRKLKVHILS